MQRFPNTRLHRWTETGRCPASMAACKVHRCELPKAECDTICSRSMTEIGRRAKSSGASVAARGSETAVWETMSRLLRRLAALHVPRPAKRVVRYRGRVRKEI